MMLDAYRKKRNFKKTPEPAPARKKSVPLSRSIFVVQKHAASHLHYDLRLQDGEALKSWAVPKGPSLDPAVKRLAMMVEDHPLDYAGFEGTIPAGNYGAGTVIVWDRGKYELLGEADIAEALARGHLHLRFAGEKLRGEFVLQRLKRQPENAWLWFKKKDEFASTEDIIGRDRSVVSGKTIEELAPPPEREKKKRCRKPPAPCSRSSSKNRSTGKDGCLK